jgi:S-adenosylmethionine:tRNA ribosyltransferase-isomerase
VKVDEFDFELPPALIAQSPVPRGESRLLVLDRRSKKLSHASIRDLPGFLQPGDLMVANDTRVIPARLLGRRVPSGGAVECLLLRRDVDGAEHASATRLRQGYGGQVGHRSSDGDVWTALVHPGQKLKPGALVRFEGDAGVLMAEILERQFFGRRRIRLWAEARPDGTTTDVDVLVDALGHVPLPPYIHRQDTAADRERYQTVFAAHRGSIAAPTAGLHFDERMLASLAAAGVEFATITLHVGYGTFKPVRAETVEAHVVDPEPYAIGEPAAARINAAIEEGRRVIAVGTTTTRALEHAALAGLSRASASEPRGLSRASASEPRGLSRASASEPRGLLTAGRGEADLFIYPGHEFRVISGLVTNFHLPRSSLLMLVASVAGRERVLDAYREAVERGYRFYSYGDAMLIV